MNPNRICLRPIVCLLFIIALAAQTFSQNIAGSERKTPQRKPTAWTLNYPLGLHFDSTIDTLLYNYQRHVIPSMVTDAYATTGNLGSEGLDMIYFQRKDRSDFFFEDALRAWKPSFDKQKFYNVYIPMTIVGYDFGGNRDTGQDRLNATFAGNVNRRIGIGAFIDYLYSKGSYNNQAVKDISYGFSGYYTGDRFSMQAFFYNYNMLNKENGGITDKLYITDPAQLQGGVKKVETKSIPTRLNDAHNRLKGTQFYMNHTYNLGYWREEEVNDTLTRDVYVPVTKFVYSFDYKKGSHLFRNGNTSQARDFWGKNYLTSGITEDLTSYWQISNTVGISMIEGFQKWAKFGLSAFATLENRKYTQANAHYDPAEIDASALTPMPAGVYIPPKASQNHLWVGGELSKQQGSILKYDASARFGLSGDVVGDIDIAGNVTTNFRMLGDTVTITAHGRLLNKEQPYLLKHYISNFFIWDNDFGKTRSFSAGGRLDIPWTNTSISVDIDNVSNYVYFDKTGMPRQHSGSVHVYAAALEQRLKLGILHWDNKLTFQTSSDSEVLPLPTLSVYSNLYLNFTAFKVLRAQVGIDCDYYTRYRGVNYQPATMSFTVGDDWKIGNFPFCNAYLTAYLYKVRFFVLYSHFNQGWLTKEYFSMPMYPVNPSRLLFGLSVNFAN